MGENEEFGFRVYAPSTPHPTRLPATAQKQKIEHFLYLCRDFLKMKPSKRPKDLQRFAFPTFLHKELILYSTTSQYT
jgi:hypothetical protein